jgi:fatty acid desaturase
VNFVTAAQDVGVVAAAQSRRGVQVMRKSFWVCLIAIAVGGISLLVKAALPEQPWLAPALLYLAIVIALLATLSLAHDMGDY